MIKRALFLLLMTLNIASPVFADSAMDIHIPFQGTDVIAPEEKSVSSPNTITPGAKNIDPPGTVHIPEPPSFLNQPDPQLAYPGFGASESADGKAAAGSLSGFIKPKYETKSGFDTNVNKPLMTGESHLQTISGSQVGGTQISNASSNEFLKITVLPTPSGELNMIVQQDSDMDGAIDLTVSDNGLSGICSDGYIKCTPGTWAGCAYFAWGVVAGQIAVTPLDGVLSGCYCINQSCGNNLAMSNMGSILNHLGGGAAGAIIAANPSYQIARAEVDESNLYIRMFGQNLGHNRPQADGSITSGSATQTQYFNNAALMEAAAISTFATESTKYGSPAAAALSLSSQTGSGVTNSSCEIHRTAFVSTETESCAGPGIFPGTILTDFQYFIYYRVFDQWIKIKDDCRAGKDCGVDQMWVGCCIWGSAHNWCPPSGLDIFFGEVAVPPAGSVLETAGDYYKMVGCDKDDGADYGEYNRFVYYKECKKDYEILNENVTDNCAALHANEDCNVISEEVDGVQTLDRYGSTGLTPIPAVRWYPGKYNNYPVVRDWWHKKRVYQCRNLGNINTSPFEERIKVIETSTDTLDAKSNVVPYADARHDSGMIINENLTANLNVDFAPEDCLKACKVRRVVNRTDAGTVTNATQQRANTSPSGLQSSQGFQFAYITCVDGTCPKLPTDTIEKPCSCVDDFAETAAVMEALNQAGKDLFCSDGVKK